MTFFHFCDEIFELGSGALRKGSICRSYILLWGGYFIYIYIIQIHYILINTNTFGDKIHKFGSGALLQRDFIYIYIVHMFIYLSIYLYISFSIYLYLYLSIDLSIYITTPFHLGDKILEFGPGALLQQDLCIYILYICLSIYLSIYLSTYLSLSLSIYLYPYLSIHLCIYITTPFNLCDKILEFGPGSLLQQQGQLH